MPLGEADWEDNLIIEKCCEQKLMLNSPFKVGKLNELESV